MKTLTYLALLLLFHQTLAKQCPAGTYLFKKECLPCPPGTYNEYPGAAGVDVCIRQACPADTFNPNPGATSRSACKPCPAGKRAHSQASKCISCPKGTVVDSYDGKQSCKKCGYELYPAPNGLECLDCRFRPDKSDKSVCTTCKAGLGRNPRNGKCVPCKQGKYNDGSYNKCQFCPPGLIGAAGVADRCVPCPPKTFRGRNDRKCKKCPNGMNQSASGSAFCIPDDAPCPLAHFRNSLGACQNCTKNERYSAKEKKCVACENGEGSDGALSSSCRRCASDRVSSKDGCVCAPGYRTVIATGKCVKCEANFFSTDGTKRHCEFCPQVREAPMCAIPVCAEGQIQDDYSGQCMDCPKGLVPRYGRCVEPTTNCAADEKRVVERDTGKLFDCSKKTCPKDTIRYFNRYSGIGKVIDCAIIHRGDFSRRPANVFAEDHPGESCPEDQISPGGANAKCTKCPKGLYRDYQDGGKCGCTHTVSRPKGLGFGAFLELGLIDGKCSPCPPGTFGPRDNEKPACIPCPAGTHQKDVGRSYCDECPRGQFSSKAGSATCSKCPKGTTNYFAGDVGCVPTS